MSYFPDFEIHTDGHFFPERYSPELDKTWNSARCADVSDMESETNLLTKSES